MPNLRDFLRDVNEAVGGSAHRLRYWVSAGRHDYFELLTTPALSKLTHLLEHESGNYASALSALQRILLRRHLLALRADAFLEAAHDAGVDVPRALVRLLRLTASSSPSDYARFLTAFCLLDVKSPLLRRLIADVRMRAFHDRPAVPLVVTIQADELRRSEAARRAFSFCIAAHEREPTAAHRHMVFPPDTGIDASFARSAGRVQDALRVQNERGETRYVRLDILDRLVRTGEIRVDGESASGAVGWLAYLAQNELKHSCSIMSVWASYAPELDSFLPVDRLAEKLAICAEEGIRVVIISESTRSRTVTCSSTGRRMSFQDCAEEAGIHLLPFPDDLNPEVAYRQIRQSLADLDLIEEDFTPFVQLCHRLSELDDIALMRSFPQSALYVEQRVRVADMDVEPYPNDWKRVELAQLSPDSFHERLRDRQHRLIVIEGEMGVGKSCLIRALTAHLAATYQPGQPIPIHVRWRHVYQAPDLHAAIRDQTRTEYDLPIPPLEHREVIYVIDGFDEMVSHSPDIVYDCFSRILQLCQRGSVVVAMRSPIITPQLTSLWEEHHALVIHLDGFGAREMREWVHRWSSFRDAPHITPDAIRRFADDDDHVLGNPLLLFMLAEHALRRMRASGRGRLDPDVRVSRTDLFRSFIDDTIAGKAEVADEGYPLDAFNRREYRWLLQDLAYLASQPRNDGRIRKREATRVLPDWLPFESIQTAFLLHFFEPAGDDEWQFHPDGFRAYLLAEWCVRKQVEAVCHERSEARNALATCSLRGDERVFLNDIYEGLGRDVSGSVGDETSRLHAVLDESAANPRALIHSLYERMRAYADSPAIFRWEIAPPDHDPENLIPAALHELRYTVNYWMQCLMGTFALYRGLGKDRRSDKIFQRDPSALYRYLKLQEAVQGAVPSQTLNLSQLNLEGVQLRGSQLGLCDLSEANLRDASLRAANLIAATLEGADLTNANLTDANLVGVNLSWANLTNATIRTACLRNAELRNAIFMNTMYNHITVFPDGSNPYRPRFDPKEHEGLVEPMERRRFGDMPPNRVEWSWNEWRDRNLASVQMEGLSVIEAMAHLDALRNANNILRQLENALARLHHAICASRAVSSASTDDDARARCRSDHREVARKPVTVTTLAERVFTVVARRLSLRERIERLAAEIKGSDGRGSHDDRYVHQRAVIRSDIEQMLKDIAPIHKAFMARLITDQVGRENAILAELNELRARTATIAEHMERL